MSAVARPEAIVDESSWRSKNLREVCRAVGGGTPPRNQSTYWNGDIPWASVKDFEDESVFLDDTQEHISEEGLQQSASTLVAPNTPVVCTRMAVGRCALTSRPTAINQDLKALILGHELEPRFFIRLLRYKARDLERLGIGTTVRGVSTGDLLNLSLRYPESIHGQQRIAAVLDTVDETIAETEAVIAKLKQVRAGLLHDLLTRGLDEHGQLRNPEQYPEQFKDSPIGRIPDAWEVRWLREISGFITYGFTNPMPTTDEGPWMLTALDIGDGEIRYQQARHTSRDAFDQLLTNKSKPQPGDILITKDGTLGRVAIVDQQGVCINQSVASVRMRPSVDTMFVVQYLRSPMGQSALLAGAGGSTIRHIYISKLGDLHLPYPPSPERERIKAILETSEGGIQAEHRHLKQLGLVKCGLMADLLTGRVRVPVGIGA